MIGFGQGHLRIRGHFDKNADFILAQDLLDGHVTTISFHAIERVLNFDWFKINVICREQHWICAHFGPNSTEIEH